MQYNVNSVTADSGGAKFELVKIQSRAYKSFKSRLVCLAVDPGNFS